jgi:hypothetical protein
MTLYPLTSNKILTNTDQHGRGAEGKPVPHTAGAASLSSGTLVNPEVPAEPRVNH